jgi:hypothetical protein
MSRWIPVDLWCWVFVEFIRRQDFAIACSSRKPSPFLLITCVLCKSQFSPLVCLSRRGFVLERRGLSCFFWNLNRDFLFCSAVKSTASSWSEACSAAGIPYPWFAELQGRTEPRSAPLCRFACAARFLFRGVTPSRCQFAVPISEAFLLGFCSRYEFWVKFCFVLVFSSLFSFALCVCGKGIGFLRAVLPATKRFVHCSFLMRILVGMEPSGFWLRTKATASLGLRDLLLLGTSGRFDWSSRTVCLYWVPLFSSRDKTPA